MTDFLIVTMTFPTLPYSLVLAFCVIYWGLAAFGIFDADGIDGMFGHAHAAGHGDFHHGDIAHGHGHGDGHDAADAAGLLARLGLAGFPMMLVVTLVAFFGWLATYFVHLLELEHAPDLLRWLVGIVVVVLAIVPGLLAASLVLRPLRRLMVRLRPPVPKTILGQVAIVSTADVSAAHGMATVDDGGAGLILQVRDPGANGFKRGDRVVLIEFLEAQHAYRVVSEVQFRNP